MPVIIKCSIRRVLTITIFALFGYSQGGTVRADAEFFVTAVSSKGGAMLTEGGGSPRRARSGDYLTGNSVVVSPSQTLMGFAPADQFDKGVVMIAIGAGAVGDTRFTVEAAETTAIRITEGFLAFVCETGESSSIQLDLAGSGILDILDPGWWIYAHDKRLGESYIVFLRGDESNPVASKIVETPSGPLTLRPGEMIVSRAGANSVRPIENWLSTVNLDLGSQFQDIGVASADVEGGVVEDKLAETVLVWDRDAQPENIIPKIDDASRFKPENRLVFLTGVESPESPNQNTTPQSGSQLGANEVPVLSPASISVGGGVTALNNNANARGLANQSNSLGLGFGGLTRLSIPAIRNGVRTVGPPGVAGQ